MEQAHTTPNQLNDLDEARIKRFAKRLGAVVCVEDLFDDGLGGDREEATPPQPYTPPQQASARVYREYFAPVISLHPQQISLDLQPRILEPVE